MAKFDSLYPNQPTEPNQQEVGFEGSALIRGETPGPCWNCGEETNWIDMLFEARLCSEECERAKWDEYLKAVGDTSKWEEL